VPVPTFAPAETDTVPVLIVGMASVHLARAGEQRDDLVPGRVSVVMERLLQESRAGLPSRAVR
jgi:hypothetical protein